MPGELKQYQRDFIQFCIDCKVLQFGSFTLKSGRTSPYFFNAGLFNTGAKLHKLGLFYAQALKDNGNTDQVSSDLLSYDMLFGPAYKGIPLVSALAIGMSHLYNLDIPYAFNRKEKKDHGEGGVIVGSQLQGKVLVVDDVITAGTAIREAVEIIKNAGGANGTARLSGVLIALDRQEKAGPGLSVSAIQQVEQELSIKVVSIVTLGDVLSWLMEQSASDYATAIESIQAYRKEWGI